MFSLSWRLITYCSHQVPITLSQNHVLFVCYLSLSYQKQLSYYRWVSAFSRSEVTYKIDVWSIEKHAHYSQFATKEKKRTQAYTTLYYDCTHEVTHQWIFPVRPRDLFSCLQKRCPECGVLKEERRFHGSRTCWDCRKDKPASLTHITASFDLSSFRQFFDHEQIQGSCLSICQRAALITLHQLNIGINQIAHLTHCDQRTIQHWVAYYNDHQCLEEEPRSGRPLSDLSFDHCIRHWDTSNEHRSEHLFLGTGRTSNEKFDPDSPSGREDRISHFSTHEVRLIAAQ